MGVEAPGKGSQDWTISLFLAEGACWMKGLRRDVFFLNKSSFFLFEKLKGLPG